MKIQKPFKRGLTPTIIINIALILLITALTTLRIFVSGNELNESIEQSCLDCKLTANSLDELLRKPRQMDSYGQISDRLDLNRLKKLVCKEISSDSERERCRNFYFSQQTSVLKWKQAAALSLGPKGNLASFYDIVCIRELKLCCPSESYGPKCLRCPKCGPNEHCHGQGLRIGNGTCLCKPGHVGLRCDQCQTGFYRDDEAAKLPEYSNKRLLCKPCHRSCKSCRGLGPKGCEVCREGFSWQSGYGCLDIDECIQSNNKICGPNTFCVNTEGSHFCYECDRACDGCHGDGPDMCLRCGPGYKLDEAGNCAATRKTILPPEANYYRYAIYAGLCICTCIILNNSVYLASLVGLGVALYIGASEYVMSGHPGDGSNQADGNSLAAKLAGAQHGSGANLMPHLGL